MSTAEISATSPFPVFVTNGTAETSTLPGLATGTQWTMVNIAANGTMSFHVEVLETAEGWVRCKIGQMGGYASEAIWIYPPAMAGFGWIKQ